MEAEQAPNTSTATTFTSLTDLSGGAAIAATAAVSLVLVSVDAPIWAAHFAGGTCAVPPSSDTEAATTPANLAVVGTGSVTSTAVLGARHEILTATRREAKRWLGYFGAELIANANLEPVTAETAALARITTIAELIGDTVVVAASAVARIRIGVDATASFTAGVIQRDIAGDAARPIAVTVSDAIRASRSTVFAENTRPFALTAVRFIARDVTTPTIAAVARRSTQARLTTGNAFAETDTLTS